MLGGGTKICLGKDRGQKVMHISERGYENSLEINSVFF